MVSSSKFVKGYTYSLMALATTRVTSEVAPIFLTYCSQAGKYTWEGLKLYNKTIRMNGALFHPFGRSLLSKLELSNGLGGIIINSTSGGLQFGIKGTKNSGVKP